MGNKSVTILMAVYKPKASWFREQLVSLNTQKYAPLELLVWNDFPGDTASDALIEQEITNFPYKIYHAEKNLGSNGAFEKLTELAKGDYLAYCDQDDIWHEDKIKKLVETMEQENATLVCSDMRVIDENSVVRANRITEMRPHQTFVDGEGQLKTLLSRNFVTGCTMLVRSDMAKKAVPFVKCMIHDHWIALWNAIYGKIVIIHEPLIDYRIHGENQSGILSGIETKADYREKRCCAYLNKIKALAKYHFDMKTDAMIAERLRWAEIRYRYLSNPNPLNFLRLLLKSGFDIKRSVFELGLPLIPRFVFDFAIKSIKEGKI